MVSFLEVELALETNQQFCGNAEAALDAQGDGGADTFFLADHIAELRLAEVHRFCGGDLGDAVVGDGVADQCSSRIGQRPWDLEWVAENRGGLRFHGVDGFSGYLRF